MHENQCVDDPERLKIRTEPQHEMQVNGEDRQLVEIQQAGHE
jgi:hypothetical protein